MIAGALADGSANPLAKANAECVGESKCERDNCDTTSIFFPQTACAGKYSCTQLFCALLAGTVLCISWKSA